MSGQIPFQRIILINVPWMSSSELPPPTFQLHDFSLIVGPTLLPKENLRGVCWFIDHIKALNSLVRLLEAVLPQMVPASQPGDIQYSPSPPFCKRFERTTFLFHTTYLLNNIEGIFRCCQLCGGLAREAIPPPAQQWCI